MKAEDWVKKLGLAKFQGRIFPRNFLLRDRCVGAGVLGTSSASTAVYYLLRSGQPSVFHRIKSDELWHLYARSALVLHIIDRGRLETITLGRCKGQTPQAQVKAGCGFAASVARSRSYSLAGCTVAPGFDFAD